VSSLDIGGIGARIEVILPRDVKEVARLAGVLGDLEAEVRSLVLAPRGVEEYAAFVRVATIDVASLKGRLREEGFKVPEVVEFLE